VWVRQDGGLMDIAVHPDYANNGWLYLSFVEPGTEDGASTTRVIRARIRGHQLVDHENIFQAPPDLYWVDNTHYGSRFIFDSEGYLYFSLGDRGRRDLSQALSSPYGKLHRVHDDGRAPADNPFVATSGAVKSIWTYGHRNPQGFAFHPETGEMWSSEHGPRGGDELNVIVKGHNYGWPVITDGIDYDGTAISLITEHEGMELPIVQWTPTIAPAAIVFYTGDRFLNWRHHLFMATLAGEHLRRIETSGRRVTHQEVLFRDFGRVRDVTMGPDGYLYLALNGPGRIARLVPVTP
jgi:glucose/arabinose dehydrogenase